MRLLVNALVILSLSAAAIAFVALAVSLSYSLRSVWPAVVATAVVCGGFALASGGIGGRMRGRLGRGPAPTDHGLRRVELADPYRDVNL